MLYFDMASCAVDAVLAIVDIDIVFVYAHTNINSLLLHVFALCHLLVASRPTASSKTPRRKWFAYHISRLDLRCKKHISMVFTKVDASQKL
jgi:hypothetical protein